jgi:hypothetical protein
VVESVYSAVRNDSLYKADYVPVFKRRDRALHSVVVKLSAHTSLRHKGGLQV